MGSANLSIVRVLMNQEPGPEETVFNLQSNAASQGVC